MLLRKFNPESKTKSQKPKVNSGRPAIKGIAHITGGGFVDNIPRVLPRHCDVVVRKGSWEMPPIFRLLQAQGRVAEPELYQVFNMGIGMTLIVAAHRAGDILRFIRTRHQPAWLIGEVVKGRGRARVE
jgi:phosphoribosylformylglycinamidine cyclo-ligase